MKNILKKLFVFLLVVPLVLTFSACAKDGADGKDGIPGVQGEAGVNGQDGKDGEDSFSSYQMWLDAVAAGDTVLGYTDWLKANFDIVIDAEKYAINKNLMSVVELTAYTNETNMRTKQESKTSGSAVLFEIDQNGAAYFVTNYHVTYYSMGAKKAYPYFRLEFIGQSDNNYSKATFVGGSSTYDIAILKVESEDFISDTNAKPVTFKSSPIERGAPVIAIGNTNGNGINISRGVVDVDSEEEVISVAGNSCVRRLIRHDAYITNGNSGGGLFDVNGDFVGITNGGQKTDERINYAIPADLVKKVAEQLVSNYKADSSSYKLKRCNLQLNTMLYDTFSKFNDETGLVEFIDGFKVSGVDESSVFFEKLYSNDIFVSAKVNGRDVSLSRKFMFDELMIELKANDVLEFKVKREGEEVTISATLSADLFEEIL